MNPPAPGASPASTQPLRTDIQALRGLAIGLVLLQHARLLPQLKVGWVLVPQDYAAWIVQRVAQGYEVVNPKRFIFYLSQAHSQAFFAGKAGLLDAAPETTVQNLEGGGSVAITRTGYARIGGLDESFIGWGGEDNEFWERAQTLRVWPWAGLPLVHLWHAAQPGKQDAGYHTAQHYRALAQMDPQERIRRLNSVRSGDKAGPAGWPLV